MTKSISELINPQDFKEKSYALFLENQITKTELYNSKDIKIISLENEKIILELPLVSGNLKQLFTLYFLINDYQGKTIEKKKLHAVAHTKNCIKMSGRVMKKDVLEDEEGRCSMELTLTEYPEDRWENFLNNIAERQRKINELILKRQ